MFGLVLFASEYKVTTINLPVHCTKRNLRSNQELCGLAEFSYTPNKMAARSEGTRKLALIGARESSGRLRHELVSDWIRLDMKAKGGYRFRLKQEGFRVALIV